jgi:glycosyltransferase involved in cell wall biosynthesis
MKILYFSRDYTTHDRRFLQALAEMRYEVYYLRFASGDVVFELRPLPPSVHLVQWAGLNRRVTSPSDCLEAMSAYEQVLANLNPDIVHAGPVQQCSFMTSLADYHPHLCMSWGSDILTLAQRDETMHWVTSFTLRQCDGFVCDSNWVYETAKVFAPLADKPIANFAWGIDLNLFPFSPPKPRETFTVLSTRSWEPLYGTDTLVEGFCQAWLRQPHLRLVMMGDGSLRNRIVEIIAHYGAQYAVQFTGMIAHHHQPAYFASADAYISCAHTDGTSISLLEAMATGLPVIVTDIPSNREWITEGVNGWLPTKGDSASTANAIFNAVALTSDERKQFAMRNRAIVEARGNWQINVQNLFGIIDQLTSKPNG